MQIESASRGPISPTSRPPRVRATVPALGTTLTLLRQRMLAVMGVSGVFWGIVAFFAVLLVAMWTDLILDLPPLVRLFAWFASLATMIVLFARLAWLAWNDSSSSSLARRLDAAGATGGQIRSGLDLSDRSNRHQLSERSVSHGMAEMAVDRASQLAARIPEELVVPAKPLLFAALGLAGMFFSMLLLAAIVPRMAWVELVRFVMPYGDQPAYSQYEFVVEPKNARVIYGESLDLSVEVRGPAVEQLELVLIPPQEKRTKAAEEAEPIDVLPMFLNPSGKWHASIANVTQAFDYFLRVRRARSQTFQVELITVPVIREVRAVITPPLYTGLAPYRGVMPVQGIEGLPGTQVTVTANSNRPLSGGTLNVFTDSDEAAIEMKPDTDPHDATGSFTVSASGRLEVQVVDEAGQSSTDDFSTPIRLLEDAHPIVRLMQPKAVSLATPTAMLPIVISAEDDYGLRNCQLFRSLNDSRYLPTSLEIPPGMPRRVYVQTILPLAEYGLEPGDEIKIFARVEDNDPNGPDAPIGKGAESAIATIRIISQEQFEQMQQRRAGMEMLMSKYQQAQRRLENIAEEMRQLQEELKETLKKQSKDSPVAEEMREKLRQLAKSMQQEAEALQKLSKSTLPFDVDKELSPQLEEMAQRLMKMSEETARSAEDQELTSGQLEEMLQNELNQLQQEQDRHQQEALDALETLRQVLPLKQAESAFVQLVKRQRQLAERLASLKDFEGEDDPAKKARIRELEEEQRRIRGALTDLLDKIEEDVEKLPEDERFDELRNSATEFVAAVRDSGADEAMVEAEEAMGRFSGSGGHAGAKRAAEILEKFLKQCESMGQAGGACLPKFQPGLGQSLQQTLNQLVPGLGMKTGGIGLGAGGMGGYSSRADTAQNMGLYGGMPFLDPTTSSSGQSSDTNQAAGTLPGSLATDNADEGSGFQAQQTNPAFGGGEWGVPAQYRRQAGRYLQKLAEELEK